MEVASIAIATMKIAAAKLSGIKTASLLSFIGGAAMTVAPQPWLIELRAARLRTAYVSRERG